MLEVFHGSFKVLIGCIMGVNRLFLTFFNSSPVFPLSFNFVCNFFSILIA